MKKKIKIVVFVPANALVAHGRNATSGWRRWHIERHHHQLCPVQHRQPPAPPPAWPCCASPTTEATATSSDAADTLSDAATNFARYVDPETSLEKVYYCCCRCWLWFLLASQSNTNSMGFCFPVCVLAFRFAVLDAGTFLFQCDR
jgi:hypothetical protein